MENENSNKVALILLGGWGLSVSSVGNAIMHAKPENFNRIWNRYPHEILSASNRSDHLEYISNYSTLSAGRKLKSPLELINQSISTGEFFKNKKLKEMFENCRRHSSSLHLIGEMDANNVNSSYEHIAALLKMAKEEGVYRIYLHLICNNQENKLTEVMALFDLIERNSIAEIATLVGGNFVKSSSFKLSNASKAIRAMVDGKGEYKIDPRQAISYASKKNISGQNLIPVVMVQKREAVAKIQDFDSLFFFNFSPNSIDKYAELFVSGFPKGIKSTAPYALNVTTLSDYFIGQNIDYHAFGLDEMPNNLIELVSRAKKSQIHIAQSQFAENVTNMLSGEDVPLNNEKWDIVPSFDQSTSISSTRKICNKTIDKMEGGKFDLIVTEFSGILETIDKCSIGEIAREVTGIDKCLEILENVSKANNVKMIITSVQGGAQNINLEENHKVRVPSIFVSANRKRINTQKSQILNLVEMLNTKHSILDIAPTVLDILGLEKPNEMTGESLAINFEG